MAFYVHESVIEEGTVCGGNGVEHRIYLALLRFLAVLRQRDYLSFLIYKVGYMVECRKFA